MIIKIRVEELPECYFCNKPSKYDSKDYTGEWKFMCEECFDTKAQGLGIGKGHELFTLKEVLQ
jgi:hypothetical protein